MKARNGFVSNSSSCSFTIYGITLDKDEFIKKMKELDPECFNDVYSAMSTLGKKTDQLRVEQGPDYEEAVFVGREWSSIKDDETGKQFKDSIKEELSSLGIEGECSTHERGWYDG
jgi:hypothetical protein